MSTHNAGQSSANGPQGPGGSLAIDAPIVVDALPDGLVPVQFYFSDLQLLIPTPWAFLPGPGRDQYVVFEWSVRGARPVDTPPVLLPNPMTAADFPYPMQIPQAFLLNSAIIDLTFRIHNGTPNSPSVDSSEVVTIRIDRDAPGGGALLPPAIFPIDPITEAYLVANPLVPMEIPQGYLGREVGDQVPMYFSDMNILPTGAPTLVSAPLAQRHRPHIRGRAQRGVPSFSGGALDLLLLSPARPCRQHQSDVFTGGASQAANRPSALQLPSAPFPAIGVAS